MVAGSNPRGDAFIIFFHLSNVRYFKQYSPTIDIGKKNIVIVSISFIVSHT